MDCKTFFNLLEGFLDGDLSQKDQDEFQVHINQCQHCKQLWEDTLYLENKLNSVELVDPPKGLKDNIMMAAKKEGLLSSKKRVSFISKVSAIAASILLIISLSNITGITPLVQNQYFGMENLNIQESPDKALDEYHPEDADISKANQKGNGALEKAINNYNIYYLTAAGFLATPFLYEVVKKRSKK